MYRLLDAGIIALFLAGSAWLSGLITLPSAAFGFTVAAIMLLGGGFQGIVILALFFPITTHLSHQIRLWRVRAQVREAEETGKAVPKLAGEESEGHQRLVPDWRQMLANGAVGCLFALAYFISSVKSGVLIWATPGTVLSFWTNLLTPFPASSPIVAGLVASLASAAADTASHEVGVTTRGATYLMIRRQRVPAGTTGAVSVLGTSTMVLTVVLFVLASWLMRMGSSWDFLLAVGAGAIIGNVFDSVLGELAERRYRVWGNNLTNLASTAVAGMAGYGLALWIN